MLVSGMYVYIQTVVGGWDFWSILPVVAPVNLTRFLERLGHKKRKNNCRCQLHVFRGQRWVDVVDLKGATATWRMGPQLGYVVRITPHL